MAGITFTYQFPVFRTKQLNDITTLSVTNTYQNSNITTTSEILLQQK